MGVFGELRCPVLHPPPPHFHPPPKKFLFLLSLQSFLPSCLLSEVYRACRPLWICLQGTLIQSVMLQNWFHVHWTDWLNGCFIFNNKRRMKRSWKKRKLIKPPTPLIGRFRGGTNLEGTVKPSFTHHRDFIFLVYFGLGCLCTHQDNWPVMHSSCLIRYTVLLICF